MVTNSDPVCVGPADDSAHLQERAYTQCVDMVNVDVDTDYNAVRREGSTLFTAGNVTSAWSNGTTTYVVIGGIIHTLQGNQFVPMGNSPSMQTQVEFCQMNNAVMFSDNVTIGVIEDGVPYVLNNPGEAADLLDLESWVQLTYPAGAEHDESNMEIDAFKIATFAGKCLEFYNGVIYLAVGNFIYCTKAFNAEKMDIRYNVVAGFKDDVTMIRAVNDGLFVGTNTEVCFLAGHANYVPNDSAMSVTHGFTQRRVLPFGAVYGSAVKVHADKITALKAENIAQVFLTSDGVYAGCDGGRTENLTKVQMNMPDASSASALIRFQGTAWQYLVCPNTTFPATLDTIIMNLDDTVHSRYIGLAYCALMKLGKKYYGANSEGLFLLEGDSDYVGTSRVAQIDAPFKTPSVDFGVKELKRVADAYLHVRTAGEMALDLYVDDQLVAGDLPFFAHDQMETGARRMRCKLPRGAKGTNWQYVIKNVDGCRFTAFSLKTPPVVSQRTI